MTTHWLMSLDTFTAIVKRYETDKYGDRILVSTHEVEDVEFAPSTPQQDGRLSSEEINDRSNTVTTNGSLYCPSGADIKSVDILDLTNGGHGDDWHVTGDLANWGPGVIARLTQRRG